MNLHLNSFGLYPRLFYNNTKKWMVLTYREALGFEQALDDISKVMGIKFDADFVDICIKLFKEKGFRFSKCFFSLFLSARKLHHRFQS